MREDITELIYAAIDELNAQSVGQSTIEKSLDTPLLGSDAGLDSLAFINLIVALEEQISRRMGISVILVDEEYLALEHHPFRTVGTMADYVERVLEAKIRQ